MSASGSTTVGHAWAINPEFETSWVRFVAGDAKVKITFDSQELVFPEAAVCFASCARELCAVGWKSKQQYQLLILRGVEDIAQLYSSHRRPLRGYLDWCKLLYGTCEQQADMVADTARTDFLQQMVARHCPGCRVLEIGVGSGVLLVFAAKAGAASIDGIEAVPEAFGMAQETLRRNSLMEQVRLHSCLAEDFEPKGVSGSATWDVIISESVGLMGFCEWMVMSVLVARRWLAPGGCFLPAQISLHACPVRASFAHAPHGVDISHIVPPVLVPFRVPSSALLQLSDGAEGVEVCRLDFASTRPWDLSSRQELVFLPKESARLSAMCVWFELSCNQSCCSLSTAPSAVPTHWQQALLSFHPKALLAKVGVPLRLRIDVFPVPANVGGDASPPVDHMMLAVGLCMNVLEGSAAYDGQRFEAEWQVPLTTVELRQVLGEEEHPTC